VHLAQCYVTDCHSRVDPEFETRSGDRLSEAFRGFPQFSMVP